LIDNTLVYYGLRNAPNTLIKTINLSKKTAEAIRNLQDSHDIKIVRHLKKLIKENILVEECYYKSTPDNLEEARFCKNCPANDYIIPGLEFDESGLCPICQTYDELKNCKSFLPIKNKIPSSKRSKYDIALFYTGGKDSSYLLYYLAKVLKLRVLCLVWKNPYISENALKSIENAKEALPLVDFVVEEAPKADMDKIYKKFFEINGNACLCPSIAYVLFYPYLVDFKIPYLVLGNEPAQIKNLIYNNITPKFIFNKYVQALITLVFNIGRMACIKKPLKLGQIEMLLLVKGLIIDPKWANSSTSRYQNEFSNHARIAINEGGAFIEKFRKYIKISERGHIPSLIQIDFNVLDTQNYNWENAKEMIRKELNWVDTSSENKGLHTSCKIEKCKEHSQLAKFRDMETRCIPFSAIELSVAVLEGATTREKALHEVKTHCGFACCNDYEIMIKGFND